MNNPVVLGTGACCLSCCTLLTLWSVGAVPPLFYGVRYNSFLKVADTQGVYDAGRHVVGPWNSFILFPASVQTVEFTSEVALQPSGHRFPALHTRTKEGLALHLQVSLQYQLLRPFVGQLYAEFNVNYEAMFISTIRDSLIRSAAKYEAADFWKKRSEIAGAMQTAVNKSLSATYATCWGLQLMVIDLPLSFDAAIVATQVAKQNVSTMHFSLEASRIQSQTDVIQAVFDKNVTVTKAYGEANYTLLTKVAAAHARRATLDVESGVLLAIRNGLSLEASDLVTYQRYVAVKELANATLLYGFNAGMQVMLQGAVPGGLSPLVGGVASGVSSVGGGARRLELAESSVGKALSGMSVPAHPHLDEL